AGDAHRWVCSVGYALISSLATADRIPFRGDSTVWK
ncbi:MAG: hypothetical protein ACI9MB_005354, partial [Verrucomicrobiales bacterium]